MKKFLFILCMLAGALMCNASQQTSEEVSKAVDNEIFQGVEIPASFPGGQDALFQWLSQHVKYPVAAQENGVQGRVVVRFVVEKDGSISNCTIVKGLDKDLDKEALRVVRTMPNWIPAKNGDKIVRSYFTLPVTFKMN